MPVLEKKDGILQVLKTVLEDVERDVHDLDGKPFNGHNVAMQFAHMAAQVDALARVLTEVVNAMNGPEECLHEGVYAANGVATMYCPHCEKHIPVEEL